jgi:TonB family protein
VTDPSRGSAIRADELTVPPKIIKRVLPEYFTPDGKELSGPETALKVELIVDLVGVVDSATIVDAGVASADLVDQTLAAVKQWRFEPGLLNGAKVVSRVTVVVKFANVRRATRGGGPPGPVSLKPTLSIEGAEDDFEKGAYKLGDPGLTLPKERRFVAPSYPAAAMRRKVSGAVGLDAVIAPDGTVARARVVRSLDPDLDAEALSTVKRWLFEPGRKDGLQVPVLVRLEVTFKLKG